MIAVYISMCMYVLYPQVPAGSKCHVSLHIHSQSEGAGECVEREDVTMQSSLATERLVGWQVGTAEGQSQPSASTAPTHDMVRTVCALAHFLHHIITCHSHPTYTLHVFEPDEDCRG